MTPADRPLRTALRHGVGMADSARIFYCKQHADWIRILSLQAACRLDPDLVIASFVPKNNLRIDLKIIDRTSFRTSMNNMHHEAQQIEQLTARRNQLRTQRAHTLARFIRAHGHPCRVLSDDTIRCASRCVIVGTDRHTWTVDTIPGTQAAVYEWLGY